MPDRHVVFHCKTLTATFLHGAQCGKNPELRAPSFKGLARYWFRALAAGDDPKKLFSAEAAVFGGARKAKGASRRGVSFALAQDGRGNVAKNRYDLLPHKGEARKRSPTEGIEPGEPFRVTLTEYGLLGHDREALEVAAASLWVALHLGGVGQRARRGAGHVRLEDKLDGWKPPAIDRTSPAAYARSLGAAVEALRAKVQSWCKERCNGWRSASQPKYPCLAGDARVQVRPIGSKGPEQAMRRQLMLGLRGYKSPAMGLPYMVAAEGEQKVFGRHASPVWLTLNQLDQGAWVLVETFLPLLPRKGLVRKEDEEERNASRRQSRRGGREMKEVEISAEQRSRVIQYLDRDGECHMAWPLSR